MPKDIVQIENEFGWTSDIPNLISEQFLDFIANVSPHATAIDIGAGLGVASLPALRAGAYVIVNDICSKHLDHVGALATAEGFSGKYRLLKAALPDLPEMESMDAVHCSNVLHFLPGEKILRAIRWMFKMTKPDGHIFIQTLSPFSGHFQSFIPTYEQNKQQQKMWPGEIPDAKAFVVPSLRNMTPKFKHVLDKEIISNIFLDAGFYIKFCDYYSRKGLPDLCRLDGRENLGLIAVRP